MKAGKECIERIFEPIYQYFKTASELKSNLMNQKIRTIADLSSAKEIEGFVIKEYNKKSIKVFNPFVEVKPITHPSKWTKSNVAKAILAGQIFDGMTKGDYTEDYAHDSSRNFGKGKQLDLINVARELIESGSSGFSIYEDSQSDGITQISLITHSYNYKILYFDVDCNHLLKAQRNTEKQRKLEDQNRQAESQVLKFKEDDISMNEVYQIKYLKENTNTNVQEIKIKFIFGDRLFYDGESNYKIVEINPLEIEDENMYALSDFFDRANGENYEDIRIIDLGSFQKAVTGYSLKQMLEEGMTFPNIKNAEPKTIEQAKEFVQKNIDGIIHIFSGGNTNWEESMKRMETDELRMSVERGTQSWGCNGHSMS